MRELKAEKIRGLDEAEIEAKIKERNEELFNLRFRNQVRQLTNPLLIRERRRDVARLMTILAQMKAKKAAGAGAASGTATTATAVAPAAKKPRAAKPTKPAAKAAKAAGTRKEKK
jgi:large subunit ribosomal protein L29